MKGIVQKSNFIFCGLFIYLIATSFINHDIYAFTVRYDSLLIFIVLGVLALPHLAGDIRNKDADLIMALAAVFFSVLFVLITHSGYGAALIPSDLALISYVSKRIRLSEGSVLCVTFAGACPVILWYSHVRWSYNFNMAGFAFMLMAYFGMILIEAAGNTGASGKDSEGDGRPKTVYIKYKFFIEGVIFVTAFILSMLYHSRTAMFGMVMFLVVYLLWGIIAGRKWLRRLVFLLATVGSVAFTAVYIRLASSAGNIRVLYKDVFSGREAIWRELWGAFLASPLTGIGSAYELKSFEIFEVHNGMFDILVVHGIIVFTLVTVLMYRMFERVYIAGDDGRTEEDLGLHKIADDKIKGYGLHKTRSIRRLAMAAAFSMMFTSFFENYFTVPPYSLFFMTFILISAGESRR